MGLLVDSEMTSVGDLVLFDENVLNVAGVEGIDLGNKLVTAQQRVIQDVERELARPNTEGGTVSIDQIVATPGLRRCHIWRTLELVYQFAFVSQGLERYQRAAEAFSREASRVFLREAESGWVFSRQPLRRPSAPELALAEGVGPSGVLEYSIAWAGASGRTSRLSPAQTIVNPTGQAIRVSPGMPPPHAMSWVVFASEAGGRPRRQAGPCVLDVAWTTSTAELIPGAEPSEDCTGDGRVHFLPKLERG